MSAAIAAVFTLVLLCIPVFIALSKLHPYELYTRYYSLDFEEAQWVFTETPEENDIGTIIFGITPEYTYFTGAGTNMLMPVELLPQWVIDNRNQYELFDYIAIYNGYFARFLFPAWLFCAMIVFVWNATILVAVSYLLSMGRIMTHKLRFSKRMKTMLICSPLPAIVCFFIGLAVPIIHILLYQIAVLYFAYMVQKRM